MASQNMHYGVVLSGSGPLDDVTGFRAVVPTEAFDGRLYCFEATLEPGAFVPPHTHSREDELTIIVSGALMFDVGGKVAEATAGACVLKPRGLHHAFWNHTNAPTRVLELHTPGLLEPYYPRGAAYFNGDGVNDSERAHASDAERRAAFDALQAEFGIRPHPERIEALVKGYGAGRLA